MLIKPSIKLSWFIGCIYSGAVLCITISILSWYLKIGIILFLFFNARTYFNRYLLLTDPFSIVSFWKTSHGYWCLQQVNAEIKNATLKRNSLITHFLLVLNFNNEDQERTVVLLTPESIGFQEFRQLLVLLYHSKNENC